MVGIINNILILVGIPFDYQKFVQGLIIIAAVILNMYTSRRSQGLTHGRIRKTAALPPKESRTADKT